MQYQFLHVTEPELLDRVHRFRYDVWCDELGYILPNDDKKERDKYDDFCDQFAVLDSHDEICATMRLIHHSPIGYPTENSLELHHSVKIYPRNKLAELSRIFISSNHRNMKETKLLINSIVKSLAYTKIKEYGIEYCYGSLEHPFLKLVNMFKIPYIPIGAAQKYAGIDDGTLRIPAILYTRALEFHNPQLLKQWGKQKTCPLGY